MEIQAHDIHERSVSEDTIEESPQKTVEKLAKPVKPSTPNPQCAPTPKPRNLLSNVHVAPLPEVEPEPPKTVNPFNKRYTIMPPCLSTYVRDRPVFQVPIPVLPSVVNRLEETVQHVPESTILKAIDDARSASTINSETFTTESNPEAVKAYDFSADTTTRFNYPMTSMVNDESSMGSFMGNNNNNLETTPTRAIGADSTLNNDQETIEFTPGLTTRRPKPIKRVKQPSAEPQVPPATQAVEQITRSLKGVYLGVIPETPTQPIPSAGLIKSIQRVKSVTKNFTNGTGRRIVPGTPQMPDTSAVDEKLYQYNLRNRSVKKTVRE
jgi:hypothetical protein